jgi:hypothetical protein
MTLLLIVINVVFLLVIAALWESWRSARRPVPAASRGGVTCRVRAWPGDDSLVRDLIDRAGGAPGPMAPPTWGDHYVLVEASTEQVEGLLERVLDAALDQGFHVLREREYRLTLRRRLRLLTIEIRRA